MLRNAEMRRSKKGLRQKGPVCNRSAESAACYGCAHVVASNDDVELAQPLLADDGIDDLLEAAASRRRADADGEAGRGDGCVHEREDTGPRVRSRHKLLVAPAV